MGTCREIQHFECFLLCFSRDKVTEECDLELILTQAFLEVDTALQKHLNYPPNGKVF